MQVRKQQLELAMEQQTGSKSGKGVRQGCILSLCLFNLYAGYIMRNAGLEEAQAGIKIAGRSINNLRYADDTTLMAESEEELKNLFMKLKQETENVSLKNSTFRKLRSWKKHETSRKTSISALLAMPKPLTVCITTNCGQF